MNYIRFFLFVLFALLFLEAEAQDKPAYKLFTKEGAEISYDAIVKEIQKSDVILFGEIHNNPMAHWLELELYKDLLKANENITLALEMLEADDQLILNEYLSGKIEENQFLQETKLWDNYKTDYKPLVELAKENNLKVIASNIPRRYANIVYRRGIQALDSLGAQAKTFIAPLPVVMDLQLKSYKDLNQAMGNHGHNSGKNLAQAQAIKDATMAHFILQDKGSKVFHINGAYHSQNGEGIIWFLKKQDPELKISTIETVEQEDISTLDKKNIGKADYIICIPTSMTKTFYSR